MKTNPNVTVTAKLGNYEIICAVEIGSEDHIREQIYEQLTDEHPEIEEDEQGNGADQITYEVTDWDDLGDYPSLQDTELFEEIADYNGYYDLDVLNAARACDIDISDADEAYSGHFNSDEEFAEEMAEQLGEIPKENHWPHYCIDWERAARDLMMDYSEDGGYYFRRF